ncbi:MAG: hypothetical protein GTN81_00750 [Proteobacteria bacterium]|nr:hypothetical protein [Pseudomonadota bacterium]
MKELITAEMVKDMATKKQGPIRLTPDTIITPAARDQADALGIEIVPEGTPSKGAGRYNREKITETVVQYLREEYGDGPLDEETVRTVVTKVLQRLG